MLPCAQRKVPAGGVKGMHAARPVNEVPRPTA